MIICYHVRLCSVVKIFSAFPVILSGTPEIFQHPINLAYQPESGFRSHGISRRYSSSFLKQSAKLQKSCGIPPPSFRIPCLRWHKSANYVLSWQIRLAEPLLGSAKLSKRLPPHVANCPPFLPLCFMANAGQCAFVSAPRCARISSQPHSCQLPAASVSGSNCVRVWEQTRSCLLPDALNRIGNVACRQPPRH